MITRRDFLKLSGAGTLALYAATRGKFSLLAQAQIPGGTLDPDSVDKFVTPLAKPPAMPFGKGNKNKSKYKIAMRQFQQQILPAGHPLTTVWSYGPADAKVTDLANGYFYPAFTIENTWNLSTQVVWKNELVDAMGVPLPHLLPVDPTLHWANPIGRRDTRPNPTLDPGYFNNPYIGADGRYIGPVPMVTHVHGAHVTEESDGYTEAWWLPAAAATDPNITWATGTFFDYFNTKYAQGWMPGAVTYKYPNDQPATTLWYHDHALGMTRLNVYAGPAGFWLIRGGPGDVVLDSRDGSTAILPGPAPTVGDYPFGTYYEIPIAIQDRSFNIDGSLFYPDNRAFFEGLDRTQLQIPFTFDQLAINPDPSGFGLGCDGLVSDVAPIWNPEFFGNMMVVNGFTWPYLDVEKRRYRFRLLNGCNSRFLILDFNQIPGVEVWQIGAEQGFLPDPVNMTSVHGNRLLMAPAERADVIVDFTNVPAGDYVLSNLGPDEPFGGGEPPGDFDVADPDSTGQVMQFRVKSGTVSDPTTPPQYLQFPAVTPLVVDKYVDVSLNEEESKNIKITEDVEGNLVYDCDGEVFGPTSALVGTLDTNGNGVPHMWADAVTENPALNTTEEWTIYNFTADAHPIHVHLVKFQVVDRQQLVTDDEGMALQPAQLLPDTNRPPEEWETGNKDTVIAYPGEVTRIRMHFDLPGFFVWHCHIVEHEDNEMMRPFVVGPQDPAAPHPHQ